MRLTMARLAVFLNPFARKRRAENPGFVLNEYKSALLAFKDLVSDRNEALGGWNLENQDHCSWAGISCAPNHRVVALNLTGGVDASCVGKVR
ncbi:probable LRR receptor-like serine/threonine-protein kinase RPK1 [Primulina huaijiensis]|uniref:probable LRR receptor-like serine/threonine-protein kinase RPK1 n=1 Tax=Primulina huaijiensis TaxID=1492673 RepID=UPI003CC75FA2